MKALLILNPGSRNGRGRRQWPQWQDGLKTAGWQCDNIETTDPDHARELARNTTGYDAVVAVGGDGTINRVLDGILTSPNPGIRMGVLYAGTSPDFCRFHGIPVDPREALQALITQPVRPVDVANIRYHDAAGTPREAHFACSCNIGIGARVATVANRLRPWLGDLPGTAAAVLQALLTQPRITLDVCVDSTSHCLPAVCNLTIGKNPWIASGLHLHADITPDDGQLYALAVHGVGLFGLLRRVRRFYTGAIADDSRSLLMYGTTLAVHGPSATAIEFDGDPRGFLPVSIHILPQALNLMGTANA